MTIFKWHFVQAILIWLFLANLASADVRPILPAGKPPGEDLNNSKWLVFQQGRFSIISLDDRQGEWIAANIEEMKTWCLTRWGLPTFEFSNECRIHCVPNKSMLKKYFNLDEGYVEIRRKDSEIEISAIWLAFDDNPGRLIPPYLTSVCLAEFEEKHQIRLGWWFKRGLTGLNSSLFDIRSRLSFLSGKVEKDEPMFMAEKIFLVTEQQYDEFSPEKRKLFDAEAMYLCLLLRKEFGQVKMHSFVKLCDQQQPHQALKAIYRFDSYQEFDASFMRYIRDLSSDIIKSKTPDSYLKAK